MAHRNKQALQRQLQKETQQLKASGELPFRKLLDERRLEAALTRAGSVFRQRLFDPFTTLSAFLSQCIASKDSSCEAAVSRVLADRIARGESRCSTDTGSYCRARSRLPEQAIADLARETGRDLESAASNDWLWKGRHVKIVDGSTADMTDTPENQAAYPQSRSQKAGLGFPVLRMVVLFSLAVGTVLECAIGACRGKKTGEQSLFREMWDALKEGDLVLGDRLFDAYRDIAMLQARGVDTIFGKKQSRRSDFRRGRKLGPDDHIVVWRKPPYDSARFASRAEWAALPDQMDMREIRKVVRRPGYKTRVVIIVTTLLDSATHTAAELLELFELRWHCELDLRCLKQTLGMRRLRCRTPEMVRKELWTYLLAYNLIRVCMAQGAETHGQLPRNVSFTAAKTHIYNFADKMRGATQPVRDRLEAELLRAIASCRIGRSGRKEPRAVKKRQQKYSYLTKPRHQARKRLAA